MATVMVEVKFWKGEEVGTMSGGVEGADVEPAQTSAIFVPRKR